MANTTCLRTLWKPIGQLSKISSLPGNCATKENDASQDMVPKSRGRGKAYR
jgi:hypothetical protein